ncbi:MAG: hypothetical protein NXY57DRAFT_558763 [Lentinula lateritia]|uniref:DUF6593 domain-containing protein n=1 Tax=Lentinula lateritia TaxID=40482 RepID=A0ABQ8V6J1_9AGAR|nr:MAG: hypothetical protein NXY57DRAFT_558763 [Lentinula lateritia]KAJ4471205.1 hypothetical protein C8R41DRAFT_776793 [Lentinula lateritia]
MSRAPNWAYPPSQSSQATAEQEQKLYFTANSVRNTTLATKDDSLYYEVVTRYWHPKLTKINILDPDTQTLRLIAEIEQVSGNKWQNGRFRVRFLNSVAPGEELGQWMSDIDFLKPTSDKIGGTFIDPQGLEWRWKTHNRRLQLVRVGDEVKSPSVVYEPHRRYFMVLLMSRHASWDVQPQAIGFLDRLLVSYILVERRRRATKAVIDRLI